MGGALLLSNIYSQTKSRALFIDEAMPDVSFGKLIYYKDSTATRLDFPKKLIILDFWFPNCSACIEMFPIMDSLQQQFNKHLQVIMVTRHSKDEVLPVIHKWEQQYHRKWVLPIVINDTILHKLFKHRAEPNYVWIAPENRFVAQTASFFITKEILASYIDNIPNEIIKSGYPLDSLYIK